MVEKIFLSKIWVELNSKFHEEVSSEISNLVFVYMQREIVEFIDDNVLESIEHQLWGWHSIK